MIYNAQIQKLVLHHQRTFAKNESDPWSVGRDSDSREEEPANHLLNQRAVCQTWRETELPQATLAFPPRGPWIKWRLSVVCDWGALQGCSQSPAAAFKCTPMLRGPNQLRKPCSVPPHITVCREPWTLCFKPSYQYLPQHWKCIKASR